MDSIPGEAITDLWCVRGSRHGYRDTMTVPGWKSRPNDNTLCGIAEAAKLLGVQRATVDKWRVRGVLPDPDYALEGGPVWWASTLRRWARVTGRARGL